MGDLVHMFAQSSISGSVPVCWRAEPCFSLMVISREPQGNVATTDLASRLLHRKALSKALVSISADVMSFAM